ncbi:MAG TPA: undecaprenyl-diphosphate phosphatase, partial [Chitinophagales bacterium]|nr:undecaprenyl-diphosphate phosphatase [Chitinophagales bacterium]
VTVYSIFLKDWNQQGMDVKGYELLQQGNNLSLFFIGNIVAFLVAILAIKSFISLLTKYGFKLWGWYRIVVGFILIIYFIYFQK